MTAPKLQASSRKSRRKRRKTARTPDSKRRHGHQGREKGGTDTGRDGNGGTGHEAARNDGRHRGQRLPPREIAEYEPGGTDTRTRERLGLAPVPNAVAPVTDVAAPVPDPVAPVSDVIASVQDMLTSVAGAVVPLTQLPSDLSSFLLGIAGVQSVGAGA